MDLLGIHSPIPPLLEHVAEPRRHALDSKEGKVASACRCLVLSNSMFNVRVVGVVVLSQDRLSLRRVNG